MIGSSLRPAIELCMGNHGAEAIKALGIISFWRITNRQMIDRTRKAKIPADLEVCRDLILEAEVGIEPAFTDLQSAA